MNAMMNLADFAATEAPSLLSKGFRRHATASLGMLQVSGSGGPDGDSSFEATTRDIRSIAGSNSKSRFSTTPHIAS